jgi:sugar phosphate isomerase/epimerase
MFKNLSPSALGVSGHQSEVIELALTYGFEGMELNIADFATRVRLKGMAYARRLIDSAKIRIGAFALPVDWQASDDDFQKAVKKLPEFAQVAAEIGCTRCLSLLAPGSDSRPYHENFEFHRHRVAEVCAALEPAGVRLALGFQAADYLRKNQAFQFIHDLDALSLLLSMVGAKNVGLLLDTWDFFASGATIESLRKLPREQIVAVQVADLPAEVAPAELGENSRWLPGGDGGRIDFAAVLTALSEKLYDGPVTAKPSRGAFQTRRRDAVVKQTGEAMDRIWRSAGLTYERKFVATAH